MQKMIITIKNMNCESCVEKINAQLSTALEKYDIKLDTKTISFEGNADIRAQVVATLADIGYEVI